MGRAIRRDKLDSSRDPHLFHDDDGRASCPSESHPILARPSLCSSQGLLIRRNIAGANGAVDTQRYCKHTSVILPTEARESRPPEADTAYFGSGCVVPNVISKIFPTDHFQQAIVSEQMNRHIEEQDTPSAAFAALSSSMHHNSVAVLHHSRRLFGVL